LGAVDVEGACRYPTVIDQAAQSLAPGFVGTDRSTFSRVSQLRVRAWHAAHATRIVTWGFKRAGSKKLPRAEAEAAGGAAAAAAGNASGVVEVP
jgi:hypothetical protein